MAERIGFIGVGIMGRPMVANLVKTGYPVTVFDIVPAAVAALESEGVPAAGSSKEVAEASDVVITMLPEDPHVEAAKRIFEAMGNTITHCGPHGAGQVVKACNQIVVALPVTALVNEMFTTLVCEGRAELDHSALLTHIEKLSDHVNGLIDEFVSVNAAGSYHLTNICEVGGLGYGRDGSYRYYMSERVVEDDPKGLGPAIMAGLQVSELLG